MHAVQISMIQQNHASKCPIAVGAHLRLTLCAAVQLAVMLTAGTVIVTVATLDN